MEDLRREDVLARRKPQPRLHDPVCVFHESAKARVDRARWNKSAAERPRRRIELQGPEGREAEAAGVSPIVAAGRVDDRVVGVGQPYIAPGQRDRTFVSFRSGGYGTHRCSALSLRDVGKAGQDQRGNHRNGDSLVQGTVSPFFKQATRIPVNFQSTTESCVK